MTTREEFRQEYLDAFQQSAEDFDRMWVVLECACEAWNCRGWAVVSNTPEAIAAHNRSYGPTVLKVQV